MAERVFIVDIKVSAVYTGVKVAEITESRLRQLREAVHCSYTNNGPANFAPIPIMIQDFAGSASLRELRSEEVEEKARTAVLVKRYDEGEFVETAVHKQAIEVMVQEHAAEVEEWKKKVEEAKAALPVDPDAAIDGIQVDDF